MSISLLGGRAKGFSLKVISSAGLRPTSVILRRKIFDRYQNLNGSVFVDACAGSGGMGLEAFSRGADQVFFLEANKKYFNTLKQNVTAFEQKFDLRPDEELVVTLGKIESWIERFKSNYCTWSEEERQQCVFFFDPPYKLKELYEKIIIQKLFNGDWFTGQAWVESDRLKGLAKEYWHDKSLQIIGTYEHSDSYLIVLENSL